MTNPVTKIVAIPSIMFSGTGVSVNARIVGKVKLKIKKL